MPLVNIQIETACFANMEDFESNSIEKRRCVVGLFGEGLCRMTSSVSNSCWRSCFLAFLIKLSAFVTVKSVLSGNRLVQAVLLALVHGAVARLPRRTNTHWDLRVEWRHATPFCMSFEEWTRTDDNAVFIISTGLIEQLSNYHTSTSQLFWPKKFSKPTNRCHSSNNCCAPAVQHPGPNWISFGSICDVCVPKPC